MSDHRKFWLGLGITIGAAVGAGLALLLSPDRGEETRQELNKWSKAFGARGREGAQRVLARSKHAVARSRKRLASETQKWRERLRSDDSQVEVASNEEALSVDETTAQTS